MRMMLLSRGAPRMATTLHRFVVAVEGMALEEIEEIELPRLPVEGDTVSTNYGMCIVTRTEPVAEGSEFEGRIVCRLP
jgi:hypothetical protein